MSTSICATLSAVDATGEAIKHRLLRLRARLTPALLEPFDRLMERTPFLSDPDAIANPLTQPLAQFPQWVSDAVDAGPGREERLADMVEAAVAGYLFVRVQDDRLDENIGDPDTAMFLADAFLIRHQSLLSRHVGSDSVFWDLFESTAAGYAAAMLLERDALKRESHCDADTFDRILGRSQPLILPGAAILTATGRWDLLEPLEDLVHHAVRAGQLVDDLIDSLRDLEAGRYTWVVRRLGGEQGAEVMLKSMLAGGIDDVVADVNADLDGAAGAADTAGMSGATAWIDARRAAVSKVRDRLLLSGLLG